jgi:hypothetical protein
MGLARHGGTSSIAFDVHLEDRGVVNQAIYRREGHGRIREDPAPVSERLVRGDKQRSAFVASADHLKQHRGLRLVLADVGNVVEDQQVVVVETIDRRFQGELAAVPLVSR